MTGGSLKKLFAALAALFAALCAASPAMAANCYYATAQGSTGPADWQTYCWLDFTGYSETTARSASGQNFSFTLSDGTVMSFNLKVSGAAMTAATSPSWSGSAVGNTAFLGIAGRPIMYQTAAGTTTIAISSIALTPPAAGTISAYMFVAADGESSNEGESLRFQTNGGNWQELDRAGPISGSTYPTTTGTGTNSFTETGAAGTVGAYIMGSTSPTSVTTTLVGGGLQGAMFAVRFASIRLNTQISGARANPADQFTFSVNTTGTGSTLATGTSTGTGLGPFTSSTPLPTNVVTTAYNFGSLQFGDAVQCTFTETPYPHLTLTKALAASGRQFSGDQFTLTIAQGATVIGTTTTTGSGAAVSNGSTPQVQLSAGTAYSLLEAAAGTTTLGQYTATMNCTNAATSSTVLPTAAGGSVTPQMGDVIACVITNTKRGSNATLAIAKSSTLVSDPVNGTTNPKAIPGAVVRYSFTVQNSGPTATDSNSVFIVDSLPAQISVGTAASPVFTQGSPTSALTFSAASDIRYSNAATAPASFAACTYSPVTTYDPAVRYVCLRPQGSMAGSTGTPTSFTLSIEGRIN